MTVYAIKEMVKYKSESKIMKGLHLHVTASLIEVIKASDRGAQIKEFPDGTEFTRDQLMELF